MRCRGVAWVCGAEPAGSQVRPQQDASGNPGLDSDASRCRWWIVVVRPWLLRRGCASPVRLSALPGRDLRRKGLGVTPPGAQGKS
jgi:hypothetical protein